MADLHRYANRTGACDALAGRVADDLQGALALAGTASLVVSGGTSPVEFFRALSQADLDWGRVTVVPSDERRVPADHADSNARMIRAELLRGRAGRADFVSLLEPPAAIADRLVGLLPFTAVVLGMGQDGHTASLFPTAPGIADALASDELCLPQEVPGLPAPRISLTPRALLKTDRLYLLLFGEDKKQVFEAALAGGPAEELPVRAVLHQNKVPVDAYWAP